MIQMKKKKKTNAKIKNNKNPMKPPRRMASDSGRTGGKIVMMREKNGRRKRLQIRGLKYTCQSSRVSSNGAVNKRELRREEEEEETEMALSLSLSISSASDHSLENYDVSMGFEEKIRGNEEKESVTCVSHGMVSVIGRRREMEDTVRVEKGLMACKERLHRVLVETVTENQESYKKEGNNNNKDDEIVWETVMESCFEKMDEEVNRGRLKEDMVRVDGGGGEGGVGGG
ncbi:hypothetical protein Pint_17696 [Pistacia integerrima]|uniref:Uncharacterized protein n=1 Tax=Pistacia integerrima TaxID=434235 RepID=A0ACC0YX59_9ROSI|nr:hypothetical protein Pint_17696 [Pistacia integerrima]